MTSPLIDLISWINIYKKEKVKDTDLWKDFQADFEEWTKLNFKMISASSLEALRGFLRDEDVWVSIDVDIARALFNTLQKENPTPWIEEETPTTENFEETVPSSLSTPQLPLKPINQPPPRSVNQPPFRSVSSLSVPPPLPTPQRPLAPINQSVNQPPPRSIPWLSVPPPLPTPQRPLAPINQLEKEKQSGEQPDEQPDGQSGERPGGQSGEQPDGPPVKPSAEPPPDEQSGGQPDEPPVKPSAGPPPDGPSVKPSAEPPPDEPSIEPPVEQPFKPPYDWRPFTSTIR